MIRLARFDVPQGQEERFAHAQAGSVRQHVQRSIHRLQMDVNDIQSRCRIDQTAKSHRWNRRTVIAAAAVWVISLAMASDPHGLDRSRTDKSHKEFST